MLKEMKMRNLLKILHARRYYVGVFFLFTAGYVGLIEYCRQDCLSHGGEWHSGVIAGRASFWCEER